MSALTRYQKKIKSTRLHTKACEVSSDFIAKRYRALADRLWSSAKKTPLL